MDVSTDEYPAPKRSKKITVKKELPVKEEPAVGAPKSEAKGVKKEIKVKKESC